MFNTLAKAVETTVGTTVTDIISSETTTKVAEIGFNTDNIEEALLCSAAGMVGIFMVVGIIIIAVSVLNKVGTKKKK